MLARFPALTCLLAAPLVLSQISDPVANDASKAKAANQFLDGELLQMEDWMFQIDHTKIDDAKCDHDVHLRWVSEVDGSIYSTPLIHDMKSDGKKEIVANTFIKFLDMIEGEDGHPSAGWPFNFPSSAFHTSPLLYDIDRDGVDDILVSTFNGEMVFINDGGMPIFGEGMVIPKLKVKKTWYKGLNEDMNAPKDYPFPEEGEKIPMPPEDTDQEQAEQQFQPVPTPRSTGPPGSRRLLVYDDAKPFDGKIVGSPGAGRYVDDPNDKKHEPAEQIGPNKETMAGVPSTLDMDGRASLELFRENEPLLDLKLAAQTDDVFARLVGLESAAAYEEEEAVDNEWVLIDPHVLCSPVIADLDRDGVDELVVAVSYYFDKEKYQDFKSYAGLPPDVDISKYVAGGIVVFELDSNRRLGPKQVKWSVHLDLTTDNTKYRAYIYSSPVLVDFDGDGMLEVIVGTSLGFIYVMEHDGSVKRGFPIQMAEIQGSVVVADINGDNKMEMIAADSRHNVAAFDRDGKPLWHRRISGFSAQAPSIGDIDEDGKLDVVYATTTGHVWVFDGATGNDVRNFPMKLGGRILSAVLLLHLDVHGRGGSSFLQMVVPAHDGMVYILDPATGCTDKLDIGENAYAMALADDVTGRGRMELLVSTMNGNIHLFETSTPYHPLRSWSSREQGANGFAARENYQGIYVTLETRGYRDVHGKTFSLHFEIIDHRKTCGLNGHQCRYNVTLWLGKRQMLFSSTYTTPGYYTETVRCPDRRMVASLALRMENEHAEVFLDHISIGFNVTFYRTLKLLLLGPFLLMSILLISVKSITTTTLPTLVRESSR